MHARRVLHENFVFGGDKGRKELYSSWELNSYCQPPRFFPHVPQGGTKPEFFSKSSPVFFGLFVFSNVYCIQHKQCVVFDWLENAITLHSKPIPLQAPIISPLTTEIPRKISRVSMYWYDNLAKKEQNKVRYIYFAAI